MKQPFFSRLSDGYLIYGADYSIKIHGHLMEVLVNHNLFAVLDVRSAVPRTKEDLTGEIPDEEPSLPQLVSVTEPMAGGDLRAVFLWENTSSLWSKTYTLECDPMRFTYRVTLKGSGAVDGVRYFSGNLGSSDAGSLYEFSQGYTPCLSWYDSESYRFKASLDCHRWGVLMAPGMHCYAFSREGMTHCLGLGLVPQQGGYNYLHFDYHVTGNNARRTGFYLATDQLGHSQVKDQWTAPALIGFGGEEERDVLLRYRDFLFSSGAVISKPAVSPVPRFWHGPMVCGWIEQTAQQAEEFPDIRPTDLATENFYEKLVAKMHRLKLPAKVLIIDDKWQDSYALNHADPKKWKDLRGFIDRRHAEGIHTLLWFKLWDSEGWNPSLCLEGDNGDCTVDPSHPVYLEMLDKMLYRLLSSDEGCYNCDGLKLDFAYLNPIGRQVRSHSGKYGIQLMYDLMRHLYERVKEIKPEAIVNCSACHPLFAHITDQARLHDYDVRNRNNTADMKARADLYRIALPGVLIDTDNAGFNTRNDTLRWLYAQPRVGVPDLYSLSSTPSCPLEDQDFQTLAQIWKEYNEKIDRKDDN